MIIIGGVFFVDVSIIMNNNVCEIKEFNNDVIKCMALKFVSFLILIKKMVQNYIYNVWIRLVFYLYFYYVVELVIFILIFFI